MEQGKVCSGNLLVPLTNQKTKVHDPPQSIDNKRVLINLQLLIMILLQDRIGLVRNTPFSQWNSKSPATPFLGIGMCRDVD